MTVAQHVSIAVNARVAALAWLNAFLAASQDEERAILYRTLSIEFFQFGQHNGYCPNLDSYTEGTWL